jgi:hypothetical protein
MMTVGTQRNVRVTTACLNTLQYVHLSEKCTLHTHTTSVRSCLSQDIQFQLIKWLFFPCLTFSSVALVHKRTMPTKRPPLVGEVSANFCGYRMSSGQRDKCLRPYSRFSRPEPLLFLPSISSVVLTRLSETRSRPNTSQKIW